MAYTKQTWDTTSYVNPTRMNHIEDGIKAVSDDSGKVNQVPSVNTDNKGYRLLVSRTNDDSQELGSVRKALGFTFNPSSSFTSIIRQHTDTSTQATTFSLGNNTADGNAGATHGSLRIYGKGSYYAQMGDLNNAFTSNRTYSFPDKNGTFALTSDLINNPYLKKTESSGNTFYLQAKLNTIHRVHLLCSDYNVLVTNMFANNRIYNLGGDTLTVSIDTDTGIVTFTGTNIRNSTNTLVEEIPV